MARSNGLDRAAVVAAAAQIADADGLAALTLGALAEKLGIRTPSLYNHVAGLGGLHRELGLLGLQQLAEQMGRAAMGRSAAEAVLSVTQAYRAYVVAHPGVYAATIAAPAASDVERQICAQQIIAIVVAALSAYALSDDDALHVVRGLRSIVHGFATLEVASGFGLALDRDESFRRLVQSFIAGLNTSQTMK